MLKLNKTIGLSDFYSVVFENQSIEFSEELKSTVDKSHDFLVDFAGKKIIYGVNTGFGPMAQYRINDEDRIQLQYNLIRSHATGMGDILSYQHARASVLARLFSLSLGYSGVHLTLLETMKELINHQITPLIFKHGGVGASGDLVQLAHLALNLIGEGEVIHNGERKSTADIFSELGIEPLKVRLREGISTINGTSVMTGIGIVNLIYAKRLLNWSIAFSALINELVGAYDDYFSKELNQSKQHSGQLKVAEEMRSFVAGSQMIRNRQEHLYHDKVKEYFFTEKVQEYYSLRCVPQILGPIWDTLEYSENVLVNEVNSANDNPIVDLETEMVYHGGNFHGDYIAMEMDKMRFAITKLSMLSERQLNYLLNPDLNLKLPAFVNLGTLGLNFGLQAAQFTATSTTAENQTLSMPAYIHSIPNNKDNQDVVSMGTNSASLTAKVIENSFEVLTIQCITVAQAIDALDLTDKISSKGKSIQEKVRTIIPAFSDDVVLYPYQEKIKRFLMDENPY